MVTPCVPSSFGDIVTAIGIVQSIYKALSDSTGSSPEYTRLIEDLRSFEDALCLIYDTLQTTPLSKSLCRAIEEETTRCLKLLRKFSRRIERYEVVLSRRWTAIWRKVTWAIWKIPEVESFRWKLSRHQRNITSFMDGLQL